MTASATAHEPIYTSDLPQRNTIRVTPELVRKLGPAGAIVFERINFRTHAAFLAIQDEDGRAWWLANIPTLSADTGIPERTVKRIIAKLVADGYIERWKPNAQKWDQSTAYSPVIIDGANVAHSMGPDRPVLDGADVAHSSYKHPEAPSGGKEGKAHSSANGPATAAQRRFAKDAVWMLSFSDGFASDQELAKAYRYIDSLTASEADEYIKGIWGEVEAAHSFERADLIDRDQARASLSARGFASVDERGWIEPEGWREAS